MKINFTKLLIIAILFIGFTSCEKNDAPEIFKGSLLGNNWVLKVTPDVTTNKRPLVQDANNSPVTLKFNPDMTFNYVSNPTTAINLQSKEMANTYTYGNGELILHSVYNNGRENVRFDATLKYISSTNSYSGTYVNIFTDETTCSNKITISLP